MEIRYLPSFKRTYEKLPEEEREHVDAALRLFRVNPLDPHLRNHKLTGSQEGMRSISAGYDLRILYVEIDKHTTALFLTVGTHDEVY